MIVGSDWHQTAKKQVERRLRLMKAEKCSKNWVIASKVSQWLLLRNAVQN
jgi:hypothetical protein